MRPCPPDALDLLCINSTCAPTLKFLDKKLLGKEPINSKTLSLLSWHFRCRCHMHASHPGCGGSGHRSVCTYRYLITPDRVLIPVKVTRPCIADYFSLVAMLYSKLAVCVGQNAISTAMNPEICPEFRCTTKVWGQRLECVCSAGQMYEPYQCSAADHGVPQADHQCNVLSWVRQTDCTVAVTGCQSDTCSVVAAHGCICSDDV
jgi:hypothetical protein